LTNGESELNLGIAGLAGCPAECSISVRWFCFCPPFSESGVTEIPVVPDELFSSEASPVGRNFWERPPGC
jgi:hypothetical protein